MFSYNHRAETTMILTRHWQYHCVNIALILMLQGLCVIHADILIQLALIVSWLIFRSKYLDYFDSIFTKYLNHVFVIQPVEPRSSNVFHRLLRHFWVDRGALYSGTRSIAGDIHWFSVMYRVLWAGNVDRYVLAFGGWTDWLRSRWMLGWGLD